MQFAIKILLSALVIAGASELAKRSTFFGAILVSLPISSILALTWLYLDTRDVDRVGRMGSEILGAIVPSLLFFVALPLLLKKGLGYFPALAASCALTGAGYWAYARLLVRL